MTFDWVLSGGLSLSNYMARNEACLLCSLAFESIRRYFVILMRKINTQKMPCAQRGGSHGEFGMPIGFGQNVSIDPFGCFAPNVTVIGHSQLHLDGMCIYRPHYTDCNIFPELVQLNSINSGCTSDELFIAICPFVTFILAPSGLFV